MMKKIVLFLCFIGTLCAEKPWVIVTVSPYKTLVQEIAGDSVEVYVLVPPGASSHTFEPSPKEMIQAAKAKLWFGIGEPFEQKAYQAIYSHHPELTFVDLRKNVSLIRCAPGVESCCKHCGGVDLHFWLSPKENQTQVETIQEALSQLLPEKRFEYETRASRLKERLAALENEIKVLMEHKKSPYILVSHPAYAYFCRDFGLQQIPIEFEGKDPTPRRLTEILHTAKKNNLKEIYVQPQYSNKAAYLIANQLGAKVVTLEPYSLHLFQALKEIGEAFADPS